MNDHLPVFIGNFRSGTTLVANLLGFHDAIAPWFETKGFCEALRWLRVLERPETYDFESRLVQPGGGAVFSAEAVAKRMRDDFKQTDARVRGELESGKAPHEYYPLGSDRVAYELSEAETAVDDWFEQVRQDATPETIREATGRLIRHLVDLHAAKSGRPVWVNKTPEIPRFGLELRSCLGPCRMVMMMRSTSDVVRSAVSLGWADARQIADWCQGMVDESRAVSRVDPGNYLELHYEGLLEDPVDGLNALLRFIGVHEEGELLVRRYEQNLPSGARFLINQQ